STRLAATASAGSIERLEITTRAPSSANNRTMPSPIPEPEPVTTATLSLRRAILLSSRSIFIWFHSSASFLSLAGLFLFFDAFLFGPSGWSGRTAGLLHLLPHFQLFGHAVEGGF